ncbi:E3 ubiquitin-protein ligase pellino homolog 1-like [Seriola lalandi dorsalis]|uniref:E3 ubiquitin-protein ligase pellino homolog 1-like n=1 Tax=Seriola lalandi dorsalis TaxID=1841481 RepID=UPI000C6FC90F|nr:E3 ubiquitin-protein ligase pellino homolog 1-like [Seriola lalandi dorsalis]
MVPGGQGPADSQTFQSTISRFACRIICQRNPPYSARIYAAGFDSSKNIFLGVSSESNELVDGSLIDLCGATLLWRTAEGLAHTPTVKHLEALRQELNAGRPQCPVGFNTLAFPSLRRKDVLDEKQPWAYMRCGHVHGYHSWGGRRDPEVEAECQERECPMCRARGPYVPLWLGCEAAFYVDAEPPTHAFAPCGHVCSEKTTAYWSQILLPHGTHAFHAACPFCIQPLNGDAGCVRLIFQSPLD